MNIITHNPYIGPRKFETNEVHLFFGREREGRDLLSLVISERLVLFYAQSGAGKSSLVNAKLIPGLQSEEEYRVLPVGRVGGGEVLTGLEVDNIYVYNLITSLVSHEIAPEILVGQTIAGCISGLEKDRDEDLKRVLIVDQFEELFSSYPEAWEKRENFFRQLAQAMSDFPRLWVVLVMREDYIASLDPYVYLLPGKLRVRYYMQRLEREAALQAIKKPVEVLRPFAEGVAEKLVDDLAGIRVQKSSGNVDIQPGQFIEPVQLQVVCYNLWENLPVDSVQITTQDLQNVGDVNQTLEKHYAHRVNDVAKKKGINERAIRECFEKKLITSSGMRNMMLRETKSDDGELNDDVIQAFQSDLVRAEQRGGLTFYELTHDRLVEPILVNNKKWFDENLSPLQRQAALWNEQGRNVTWLLGGQALVEVETWANSHLDELTKVDKDFLGACQEKQAEVDNINREREIAQQRELEQMRQLAVTEQQRAKEQEHAASLLRIRNRLTTTISILLLLGGCIAVILAGLAWSSKSQAKRSEAHAIQMQQIAETEKKNSDILALVATAKESLSTDPEISLILSREALEMSNGLDNGIATKMEAFDTLQNSLQASRIRKTLHLQGMIYDLAYAPNGKYFATAVDGTKVIVWDSKNLTQRIVTEQALSMAIAISSDSQWIAFPVYESEQNEKDAYSMKIWSEETGSFLPLVFEKENDEEIYTKYSFNTSGTLLAAGTYQGNVLIWETSTGKLISSISVDDEMIPGLEFSPDNSLLAVGSNNGPITLWDASTGELLSTLDGHVGYVSALAFNQDGTILASAGMDTYIRIWVIGSGMINKPMYSTRAHDNSIFDLAFYPEKQILVSASADGMARAWAVDSKKHSIIQMFTLAGHNQPINSLAISPDGLVILTADRNNTLKVWDGFMAHSGIINSITFAPKKLVGQNDYRLATASDDGTVKIWIWNDGSPNLLFSLHSPQVSTTSMTNRAIFSPSGKVIVTSGDDHKVALWDALNGNFLREINVHKTPYAIVFSPDDSLIAVAGQSELVKIYRVETGDEVLSLPQEGDTGHTDWVNSVDYSPDGKFLATAGQDGYAIIWDAQTGKELHRYNHNEETGVIVDSVFFHDDILVTIDSKGRVIRLDPTATKDEQALIFPPLTYHQGITFGVFSPDGSQLASTGFDQQVVVISPVSKDEDYQVTYRFTLPINPKAISFSSDGKYVVLGGSDAIMHIFPLNQDVVTNTVNTRVTRKFTMQECVQYFQGKCPPRLQGDTIVDDFSQDQGLWTTQSDTNGTVSIVDEHLKMELKQNSKPLSSYMPNQVYVDGTIDIDVQVLGLAGIIGIKFRSVSNDFLIFVINEDGKVGLAKQASGNLELLAEDSIEGFQWNSVNHLKVECSGNQFALFVNGERTIDYKLEDTSGIFAGGEVGLYAENNDKDDPNMTVVFDNFAVTPVK